MLEIGEEVSIVLQAFLSGNIVYLSYSAIRILRRMIRHSLFFVSLEDFLFWIGTGLYLFLEMFNTSDGSIRWYFVLGVVVGVAISSLFLRKLEKVTKKIYTSKSEKNFENVAKKSKKRYDNRY